jgi:tRNA (guanine37-N1)-methyltransferase
MTHPWYSTVVTLFPELFPGPLGHSLTGKALSHGLWCLDTVHIRDFAHDRHKTVDDTPYGGGVGMVLKPDVVHDALEAAKSLDCKRQLIYLTPRGKPLSQDDVRRYAWQTPGLIILCGRYEGVDERVLEHHQLEEVSIGDYVLTGGELAAFPLLDACVRLLPGVIGKEESHQSDSFEDHLLEYPLYTKPQIWQGYPVPEVLLSGDHQKIARWRLEQSKDVTRKRRPDLWVKFQQDDPLS